MMMNTASQARSSVVLPDVAWALPRLWPAAPARALRVVSNNHVPSVITALERTIDREFIGRGGLARGDELLALVRARCDQPISRVARWIVGRELVQYRSGIDAAFPLFQFDLSDMSIRPAVRGIIAELSAVLDDAELARWFVRSNATLANRMPIDMLDGDPAAVIEAARADRFVIRG